jgi:hypothetical protein
VPLRGESSHDQPTNSASLRARGSRGGAFGCAERNPDGADHGVADIGRTWVGRLVFDDDVDGRQRPRPPDERIDDNVEWWFDDDDHHDHDNDDDERDDDHHDKHAVSHDQG